MGAGDPQARVEVGMRENVENCIRLARLPSHDAEAALAVRCAAIPHASPQ
jgi:hypothetical protein